MYKDHHLQILKTKIKTILMKTIAMNLVFILFALACTSQNQAFDYFENTSPGEKIELFAPDIVSLKNSQDACLAVSPAGDEAFFAGGPAWPEGKIMHVRKINGRWTGPEIAEFSTDCNTTEPAFSPDGKYLYYSSNQGMKDSMNYCIWRVEKVGDKWDKAKKVIDFNNPGIWEFHPSIANDGTVYFCYWESNGAQGSIYKSVYSEGIYSEPEKVAIPFGSPSSDTNPFIDPDGKYIITSSVVKESKGGYDVYISYRKEDGSWSEPVRFDDRINTSKDDNSFDISPDGRFLFIYREGDVYWTEASLMSLMSHVVPDRLN